jgi:hypothetical protein
MSRLKILNEEEVPAPASPYLLTKPKEQKAEIDASEFVKVGLQLISKRFVQIISHLLPIISISLLFILGWSMRENPGVTQLLELVIFGSFSVGIILIRRE